MVRLRRPAPSYVPHKQSGRGRLVWYDATGLRQQKLLPGPFGSKESLAAKARLELELAVSHVRTNADPASITVAELLAAYLDHAEQYYVDFEGKPTKELVVLKYAMKPLREFYPHQPAYFHDHIASQRCSPRAGIREILVRRDLLEARRRFDGTPPQPLTGSGHERTPVTVVDEHASRAGGQPQKLSLFKRFLRVAYNVRSDQRSSPPPWVCRPTELPHICDHGERGDVRGYLWTGADAGPEQEEIALAYRVNLNP